MFYKYLDKSKKYFEYGSGGSTYQASIRKNIQSIYSVESDPEWHNKLKTLIPNKNHIIFKYCEMKTKPNTWGNPGAGSTLDQWVNYSSSIRNIDASGIDLVLIDGRFRVACCLKCFDAIGENCLIAFDDFLDRPGYHVVLDFYTIIDKTPDNRMVILKKKKGASPSAEMIAMYEQKAG